MNKNNRKNGANKVKRNNKRKKGANKVKDKNNNKRTSVELVYNPYKKESKILLNGKETDNKFDFIKKERIQFYLLEGNNWKGLIPELSSFINDKFDITFKGRKIDYEDLKILVDEYKSLNKKDIKLNNVEASNDLDIIARVDKIVDEFKKGPIPELKDSNVLAEYEKMKNQEFDINVIATMSAGKSTLINSMLGADILPSSNEACTATITRIKNIDSDKVYVECRDANKNIIEKRRVTDKEGLVEFNKDEKIIYMNVECKMTDISAKDMKLVLVDTPGPNNSQDRSHKEITDTIINDKNKSVVLYLMNGTQLNTNDDCSLLNDISDAMKKGGKQSRDRFIFVVNKCDEFDEEKGETVEKILGNVRKYLKGFGIENPNLFPITAQLAKVIRMNERDEKLSRNEKKVLNQYDDFIDYEDLHFENFASLTPSARKKINEKIELAKRNDEAYELALIHSGVPAIEETIKEYLAKYAYPIKIEKAVDSFKSIINEKQMLGSLDEELANNSNLISKLQEQIAFVQDKVASGEEAKLIKAEINKFKLDEDSFDEIEMQVEQELAELTKPYQGKEYYEEEKGRREIERFSKSVEKISKQLEDELKRLINNNVIKVGENLIVKYKEYLKEFENDINIGGFTFEKMDSIQRIKLNNVDELIEKNSEKEDIMEDRVVKAEKSFWNPFSWFRSDTIETVKIGEKTNIDVYNVMSVSVGRIMEDVIANISSAKKKAINDINELKAFFEEELDKLDKKILEIMDDIKEKTNSKEEIEKRIEETKDVKIWLEGIIKELDNILNI